MSTHNSYSQLSKCGEKQETHEFGGCVISLESVFFWQGIKFYSTSTQSMISLSHKILTFTDLLFSPSKISHCMIAYTYHKVII